MESLLKNYHNKSKTFKKFDRSDFAKEFLDLYESAILTKYQTSVKLICTWATEVFCEVSNDVVYAYYKKHFDISVKKRIEV